MSIRKIVTKLRDLVVDEVSLVDRPANPGALILLKKRDADELANVQTLLRSMGSIIGADVSKREKADALQETLEQYAEHTGRDGLDDIETISRLADARAPADDEQARKEAVKEGKTMNKSQLVEVAKRVIAGSDKGTTRADLLDAARKAAIADRQSDETIEKALGRFWESAEGRGVYHALQVAKVEDQDELSPSAIEFGPAMKALHKRADEIRSGKSMTREQAVAKIAVDPLESRFWNAARAEERERARTEEE